MDHTEKLLLRQLQHQADAETDDARTKYTRVGLTGLEDMEIVYGLVGMEEEIGKLVRTFNKLRIVVDATILAEWREARDLRFVTTLSMLDRIYLLSRKRDT